MADGANSARFPRAIDRQRTQSSLAATKAISLEVTNGFSLVAIGSIFRRWVRGRRTDGAGAYVRRVARSISAKGRFERLALIGATPRSNAARRRAAGGKIASVFCGHVDRRFTKRFRTNVEVRAE